MYKNTNDSPYGYWIGKNEIIPVTREMTHLGVLITNIFRREPKYYQDYKWSFMIAFRLGYVRVVNHKNDSGHDVQYWRFSKLSKLQKSFVKDAEYESVVSFWDDCSQ